MRIPPLPKLTRREQVGFRGVMEGCRGAIVIGFFDGLARLAHQVSELI